MHISRKFGLLTVALVVALGISPAQAYKGGGGGGGGGGHSGGGGSSGGGSHSSGGGGGGFHGGGSSSGGSSSGGGGGAVHSSGGGGSTAHTSSGSSGVSSTGASHSTSGSAASSGSSAGAHINSSTASQVGVGSRTPSFSANHTTNLHSSGTQIHAGAAGVHAGNVGAAGPGGAHANVNAGNFSRTNINAGNMAHGNVGLGHVAANHAVMHTGVTYHNGFNPGNHMNPGFHNAGFAHNPGMHVNNMGVAHFGNHNLHLAGAGYHPAYFHHSFYHGPWSGHGWGWGWGLHPAYGFGFGWGPGGWGVGLGWGYGGGWGPYSYWGPYGYWGRPLGWGFGAWGLGCGVYSCGYYPYYNPYYVAPVGTTVVYNYSNPVPVDTSAPLAVAENPADQPNPAADNPDFDVAREAFGRGDYRTALLSVDAAIARVPTDAVLHEFRALVLFALREYRQSAGVVHSLLAVGPGWDWTTMSALYPDPNAYTEQLRALEDYTLANPDAAHAHFLLGYHYMICSHKEASANQLQLALRLEPKDRLAGELLKMVQGPPQAPTPPNAEDPNAGPQIPATPGEAPPEPPAVDKDLLPGKWRSERSDGSKFSLILTDDGQFTWKFSGPQQNGDEFSGTYTVDGPVLMLQRAGNGGALAGVATFDGDGRFNFKMVGGPPEDKGLDFVK